jgi:hypothetical protein
MRTIHARGILKIISYDLQKQLENEDLSTQQILVSLKKRIGRLKKNTYEKIYWN